MRVRRWFVVLLFPCVVAAYYPRVPAQTALGPQWTEPPLIGWGPGLAFDTARGVAVLVTGNHSGTATETWEWDGRDWVRRHVEPGTSVGRLAYDAVRGEMVRFGGWPSPHTSTWDGMTWTRHSPPSSPLGNQDHDMAGDAGRGVVVLHESNAAGETWEWDGATWTRVAIGGPPQRRGFAMAHDPVRGCTVLFGGRDAMTLAFLEDTWEWDGSRWSQRQPVTAPPARTKHALSWNGARGVVVLYGGEDASGLGALRGTWEWDGQDWRDRGIAAEPGARSDPAMTYDSARQTVLLFGGRKPFASFPVNQGIEPETDTWELGGAGWVQRQGSVRPVSRSRNALAFCAASDRVVVFGGVHAVPVLGGFCLDDTWEWDGTRWHPRVSANKPPIGLAVMAPEPGGGVVLHTDAGGGASAPAETWRWDGDRWLRLAPAVTPPSGERAMAYDAARQRTVLFVVSTFTAASTWEWDGTMWRPRGAGPPLSPSDWPAMAYDAAQAVTVLHSKGQTWEWDGSAWTQRQPPTVPPTQYTYSMAYDAGRQRIVLLGSTSTGSADVWEWVSGDWQLRTPAQRPRWRGAAPLAYDPRRECIVTFGGGLGSAAMPGGNAGDTWVFATNAPASYDTFGPGCAGTAGVPVLAGANGARPWSGEAFTAEVGNLPPATPSAVLLTGASRMVWNGLPLPLGLWSVGMPGCDLRVAPEVPQLLAAGGGVVRWSFSVPATPALVGAPFYQQVLVPDPGANPLGAVLSNAVQAVVGVR